MNGEFSIKDIKEFILKWNSDYPIDRYWRKKHNVAFNSEVHRQTTLLDMRIEFEEDQLFNRPKEDKSKMVYSPGTNNYLKKRAKFVKVSEQEAKDIFDSIDITQLNETEDGEIILK